MVVLRLVDSFSGIESDMANIDLGGGIGRIRASIETLGIRDILLRGEVDEGGD